MTRGQDDTSTGECSFQSARQIDNNFERELTKESQVNQYTNGLSSILVKPNQLTRYLLVVAVLLIGTLLPAQPALAQDDTGFASYWSLTFDFDSNFNGNLYIEIGYDDGSGQIDQPALVTQTFEVGCHRIGAVGLAGGAAVFQGGYVECNLDIQRAMAATVALCREVDGDCDIALDDKHVYPYMHMEADVYSTVTGFTPLFYHRDARYHVEPQTHASKISATLSNAGTIESSSVLVGSAVGSWLHYEANYECNPCAMHFTVDGTNEIKNVGPDQQTIFYTPESTIYIGYDAKSGTAAPNNTGIGYLKIDPPNMGSGG